MPDPSDETTPPVPPSPSSVPPPSPPPVGIPGAPPPPPPVGDPGAPPSSPPDPAPAGSGPFSLPPGAPTAVAYGQGKVSASDDRTFCILSHALAIVGGFLAPLLFWLIKKDESPAVDAHAKESLNFQINIVGWFIISFILTLVSCGVLFFLPWIVILYNIVLCIVASMRASEGQLYRYPMTIRLIK